MHMQIYDTVTKRLRFSIVKSMNDSIRLALAPLKWDVKQLGDLDRAVDHLYEQWILDSKENKEAWIQNMKLEMANPAFAPEMKNRIRGRLFEIENRPGTPKQVELYYKLCVELGEPFQGNMPNLALSKEINRLLSLKRKQKEQEMATEKQIRYARKLYKETFGDNLVNITYTKGMIQSIFELCERAKKQDKQKPRVS